MCDTLCKDIAKQGIDIAERKKHSRSMLRAGTGALESRLYIACLEGFFPAVRKLIIEGANVNVFTPTSTGDSTPLLIASERGHLSCVRALLEAGADVNWANRGGFHALITASEFGHIEIVKLLLLQAGINVNIAHSDGRLECENSLMRAITRDHVEIVRALLAHPGILVNAKRKNGAFALLQACLDNKVEIALMLLAHSDIDVNLSVTSKGIVYTCLFLASKRGYHDIVSALLAHPTIDMQCPINAKCLIVTSANGHLEVARLLLSHPDVDVNLGDKKLGLTALCMACNNGHNEVVQVLLSAPSIDINKSALGLSPLDFAKRKKHTKIVSLLIQAGAH